MMYLDDTITKEFGFWRSEYLFRLPPIYKRELCP